MNMTPEQFAEVMTYFIITFLIWWWVCKSDFHKWRKQYLLKQNKKKEKEKI
jgi:hypothetical protein